MSCEQSTFVLTLVNFQRNRHQKIPKAFSKNNTASEMSVADKIACFGKSLKQAHIYTKGLFLINN